MDATKLRSMQWVICRDRDGNRVLAQVVGFSVGTTGEDWLRVAEDNGKRYSLRPADVLRVVDVEPDEGK